MSFLRVVIMHVWWYKFRSNILYMFHPIHMVPYNFFHHLFCFQTFVHIITSHFVPQFNSWPSSQECLLRCFLSLLLSWFITTRFIAVHKRWFRKIILNCISGLVLLRGYLQYILGYRSLYREWPRAGRPRFRSSTPGRGKIFLLSTFGPVLLHTQPPTQLKLGAVSPRIKRLGLEAHRSPPTSSKA